VCIQLRLVHRPSRVRLHLLELRERREYHVRRLAVPLRVWWVWVGREGHLYQLRVQQRAKHQQLRRLRMQHGVLANTGRRDCEHFGCGKLQRLRNRLLSRCRQRRLFHVCHKLVWSGLVDLQWRLLGVVPSTSWDRHHHQLHRKVCGTQPRLVQRCQDGQSEGNNWQ
jgi:hypothetical protein